MTVISSFQYPNPESLPLITSLQYHEPFNSGAVNRKLRGVLKPGIYSGFTPVAGAGLNLTLQIDSTDGGSTASVNIGDYYQLTIRQQADISIALTAGTTKKVVLQATYAIGTETYQVNKDSTIAAAEIVLLDSGTTLSANQLELCAVTIPVGTTQITSDMISATNRVIQTLGVTLSNSYTSDSETTPASSKAVSLLKSYVDAALSSLSTAISTALSTAEAYADSAVAILKTYCNTTFATKSQLNVALSKGIKALIDGSNNLVLTLPAQRLVFRSATLTDGQTVTVELANDLTLTIPSGATLGTVASVLAYLVPVVLYNGGSPVLGVVNLAGGLSLTENELLTTTAISASATSAAVVYSSSAVTSSPYIIEGLIQSTQATAGSWATQPSSVAPRGTNLVSMVGGIGFGRLWVDYTFSRSVSTTYYNTMGRPIVVVVRGAVNSNCTITVNGVVVGLNGEDGAVSGQVYATTTAIVPVGASYVVTGSIATWAELR